MNTKEPSNTQVNNEKEDPQKTKKLLISVGQVLAGAFSGFCVGMVTAVGVLLEKPAVSDNIVLGETTVQEVLIGLFFEGPPVPIRSEIYGEKGLEELAELLQNKDWKKSDLKTKEIIRWSIAIDNNNDLLDKDIIEEFREFPCEDLDTIDKLWSYHSNGHFGLRVQQAIWQDSSRDAVVFADKVGWEGARELKAYRDGLRGVSRGQLPSSYSLLQGYPINDPVAENPELYKPRPGYATRIVVPDTVDLPIAAYIEIPEACPQ